MILAHAGPCAINLYGLPRQFGNLVLPGILRHIIRVNAPYQCDYYVHYYNRTHEDDYRGADRGRHGVFDPHQVRQLTQAVRDAHHAHNNQQQLMTDRIDHYPVVEYVMDSEESFYEQYQPLLERIFTERGKDGELLYIPHSEKEPFPNATLLNIVKMFHSQQSVWNLMEKGPPPGTGKQKHYSRVAMFRSDLLYMTPIDIYQLPDGTYDLDNQYVVIPNFGRYPVNDRLIVGPWDAVRVWAAQRFSSLARHVRRWPGHGLHSEKMLYYTLFPAMLRDVGIAGVLPAPALCALRVRADAALRFGDCGRDCETWHNQQAVEYLLQRYCRSDISNPNVTFLECHDNLQQQQQQQQQPARDGFPAATWEHCEWKG